MAEVQLSHGNQQGVAKDQDQENPTKGTCPPDEREGLLYFRCSTIRFQIEQLFYQGEFSLSPGLSC